MKKVLLGLLGLFGAAIFAEEPLAAWSFEEGTGGTAESVGRVAGLEVLLGERVRWVKGPFGTALAFDGAGNGTHVPVVPGFGGDAFTVCLRARWNGDGKGRYPSLITGSGWGRTSSFLFHVCDGALQVRWGGPVAGTWREGSVLALSKIPSGKWVDLALVFAKPVMTVYVDGKAVGKGTWKESFAVSSGFTLGGWNSGVCHNGFIDDLAFYGKALSADDLLARAGDSRHQEIAGYQDDGTGGIAPVTFHGQEQGECAAFESAFARLAFDLGGRISSLREKASGRELVTNVLPFAQVVLKDKTRYSVRRLEKRGKDRLVFSFPAKLGELVVSVKSESFGWTFTAEKFTVKDALTYDFARIFPSCRTYVGTFANAMSDDRSAVFVRGYEPQTETRASVYEGLCVRVDAAHGFTPWRAGLMASPRAEALKNMRAMTLAAGVPHSDIGGAWSIGSEGARRSYVFAEGFHPYEADYWVELAERGGFKIVHLSSDWAQTLGHYDLRKAYYPNGMADMKAATDKIHAAGLLTGIHTLTACISAYGDAWVTNPVANAQFVADYNYTLAKDVSATEKDEIVVNELPGPKHALVFTYSCNGNVLRLGSELVQYSGIRREKPYAFTGLKRGAFGTKRAAYAAGSPCAFLHQRYIAFYPDPDSKLADELADRLAKVFNDANHEEFYYDGSEGMGTRYGIDALRWKIFQRLAQKPGKAPSTEASCRGANNWWFQTRTGTVDHPVWSAKRFHDSHVRDAVKIRTSDFIEPQMGWWQPRTACPWARGHFPEDMEYFASQNAGIDAAMSIQGVGRKPLAVGIRRQLTKLGWYERFRLARAFAPGLTARMAVPGAEFRLRQASSGTWRITPVEQFAHRAGTLDYRTWHLARAKASRTAVRVEALYAAKPYTDKDALALLSVADVPAMKHSAAPGVTTTFKTAQDARHGPTMVLTARNASAPQKGSWARAERSFPLPYRDFGKRAVLGTWVKGDGSGALFTVQVSAGYEYHFGYSDHQVRLDFKGWRYLPLFLRERDVETHSQYQYPYGGDAALYRTGVDTRHVGHAKFYLNDVPAGKTATVEVAEVRLVDQIADTTCRNVALTVNGKTVKVPFAAMKGGDYAELEDGTWVLYNELGEALERVTTGDAVALAAGDNACAVAAEGDARVETTFFALGETEDALVGDLTPAMKATAGCEYVMPFDYKPAKGLDTLPDVAVRPGEKARIELTVDGPVKGLTFTTATWFGLGKDVVTLPDIAQGEIFRCRDGLTWQKTDVKGKVLAEGTLAEKLPVVRGCWKPVLSCADPDQTHAVISVVKRYLP